ncbi:hypothetical protein PSTG_11956 [Puccinia striiformis f. sp. tritici PST-78]|uniref:Uncharacterized protein n=1 Tax=Puccinia striiformis f. sp. tritici PST-78 TaxID=1165861 RepID=A0A0L0V663_9BASI|nr:hypothetical protein PSTG_11956 [Puccinia striiformis f. sp. tritici PST-78]
MATGRAPNHPVHVTGLFETLDESVPDSNRANQYGNVTTPSCVSCAGLSGSSPEDFELTLTTNTALNNVLEPASMYFLAGRLLAPNDGSTPTLAYQQPSVVRSGPAGSSAPDFTNKINVIGLGLVTHRQDVVENADEGSSYLAVTLQHSDWDSIARTHRPFTVRYIVPGSKIFIKTHGLYVIGREMEITGNLIDFDMEQFTAVVLVNSVAVTTGHQLARGNLLNSSSPSASKSGKKFGSSIAEAKSSDATHNIGSKGKEKAHSDDLSDDTEEYDSDAPIASSSKVRPRTDILKGAAKRMKK